MHEDLKQILAKTQRSATLPSSADIVQQMPLKPAVFNGRDAIKEIAQLLIEEETSRVCILGAGGMGMTSNAESAVKQPLIKARFAPGDIASNTYPWQGEDHTQPPRQRSQFSPRIPSTGGTPTYLDSFNAKNTSIKDALNNNSRNYRKYTNTSISLHLNLFLKFVNLKIKVVLLRLPTIEAKIADLIGCQDQF